MNIAITTPPRRLVCCGTALLLAGCQTAPVKVGWYMNNRGSPVVSSMHLAFLNTGRCDIALNDLVLNPSSDAEKTGWRYTKLLPILRPGELVVMSTRDFLAPNAQAFGPCQIPVTVLIQSGPHGRLLETTVTGSMPNYLDDSWLKNCRNRSTP